MRCWSLAVILALSCAAVHAKAGKTVTVADAQFGVVDSDQTTQPKLTPVSHPDKMAKVPEADHHHKIIFKFSLKDKSEKILAHQAFVRLAHSKTGAEIIFVAEADSNKEYKFEMDVNAKSKEFGSASGLYSVHLIVGDAAISNPVWWHVTDVNLKFLAGEESSGGSEPNWSKLVFNPLPEIRHMFREPEKRPPAFISNLFTLLCLAPILVMFLAWLKIGVNISGFPFSLGAIGFHLGLGGIFGLYYYFWLQLNMFATVKYLLMIGVVTFLCGNSMLVGIAQKKKQ